MEQHGLSYNLYNGFVLTTHFNLSLSIYKFELSLVDFGHALTVATTSRIAPIAEIGTPNPFAGRQVLSS